MDTQATQLRPSRAHALGSASAFGAALPFLALLVVGLSFPLFGGGYWGVIATRACVYWVLVSGLNLVVGFAGQIAIGWVALLTLGAYTTSVLAAGNVMPALPPYLALAIAAVVGAVFGLIVGLPALRLRTFYFAITTLGFATIVTQVALAWQSVTGGGVGVAGPIFPEPFASQWGFYYFCFGLAAICTWMTANIAASRFGRALTAIRDAEVAAEASGISKPALLGAVFLFSGAVAAVAGGLFASLQSYITPDAFTLDLSVLFFIAILIGGRGSILRAAARHDSIDRAAGIRRTVGRVVDVSLCGAAARHRACDPRRHCRDPGFQEPPPARERPRDHSATRPARAAAWRGARCRRLDAGTGGAELRRRACDRRSRPRDPARSGARTDRPQRQRQDHDAERHLRLLRAAARRGQAERRRAAGACAPPARAHADCAHVPDPAHRRLRLGAAERHDRRHHRRRGHLRRIIAVAAAPSARRSHVARHRHAGLGGGRAGAARPGAGRPVAAQRVALHRDRSRVDAAARRSCCSTSRRPGSRPRRSRGSARCCWRSPGPAPACCW